MGKLVVEGIDWPSALARHGGKVCCKYYRTWRICEFVVQGTLNER